MTIIGVTPSVGPSRRAWRPRGGLRRGGALLALVAVIGLVAPAQPVWADTIQDKQWYLDTLQISEVHEISKGEGVTVAVVDSGVGEHIDLEGQVLTTGYSRIGDATDFNLDTGGHGTAMAGLIAGIGTDTNHYLGIAPQAKILSVKVSSGEIVTAQRGVAEAVRWAVDNGAKIINIPLGWDAWSTTNEETMQYALSQGALIVASTGNIDVSHPESTGVEAPASIPGVIAVTGTGKGGNLTATAVSGEGTTIAAPGTDIPVLVPPLNGRLISGYTDIYSYGVEGTSASTAIVSGAAALIWSKYPDLTANDVIERLITTADDKGATGYDTEYGYGELNILEALTADVPTVVANPLTTEGASANAQAAAESDDGTSSNTALIIGLVVAIVALLAITVLGTYFLRQRPAQQR